ncbi:MAG: hypothetical protein HQ507_02050 [Candidatus Marinimicrobia bacterium]|nr:hypothetical protein [Candidatus Neomarinimicrobiota bacterium]
MMHFKKMLRVMLVIYGIILHESVLHAAFEYSGLGWPAACANIKVLGSPHPDRLLLNPALLTDNDAIVYTFEYQRPFQGLDLQAGSLTSVYTLWKRPFISGVEYFGDELYSEWKLSSGSTWSITQGVKTGLSINYRQLRMSEFRTLSAATLSASLVLDMGGGVRIGTLMEHFVQVQKTLPIPQKFHFGTDYNSGPINILFALEKEAALPMEVCLGMVFSTGSTWQLAFGYRDLSQTISTGWRFILPRIGMNYTCVIHPELPLSHGFGLEFYFK